MDLMTNKQGVLELSDQKALDLICAIRSARRISVAKQATRRKTARVQSRRALDSALEKLTLTDLEELLEAASGGK
jgi:hypothetical protein